MGGPRASGVRDNWCDHSSQVRSHNPTHDVVYLIFPFRLRIRRHRDRLRNRSASLSILGASPTSNPLPQTAHIPHPDGPPDSPSHPPYPSIAHTHSRGRTVRALDTDESGRRSGTGGDHGVQDKEVLPAYDGYKGGPPKYEES